MALHLQGLLCLHGSAVAVADYGCRVPRQQRGGQVDARDRPLRCRRNADHRRHASSRPEGACDGVAINARRASSSRLGVAPSLRQRVDASGDEQIPRERASVAPGRTASSSRWRHLRARAGACGCWGAARGTYSGDGHCGRWHAAASSSRGNAIGKAETMNLFLRASDIVRAVPVYRLQVARDFDRLPDVVDQIRQWHSAAHLCRRRWIAHDGHRDRDCQYRRLRCLRLDQHQCRRTRGLTKSFTKQRGWRAVVSRQSARVGAGAVGRLRARYASGEFFGLLGENGAGKTTLFKMLATLVTPDAGTAIGQRLRHAQVAESRA